MTVKKFLRKLNIAALETGTVVIRKPVGCGTSICNLKGKRGIDIVRDKDDYEIENIEFDEDIMIIQCKQ